MAPSPCPVPSHLVGKLGKGRVDLESVAVPVAVANRIETAWRRDGVRQRGALEASLDLPPDALRAGHSERDGRDRREDLEVHPGPVAQTRRERVLPDAMA